MATLTDDGEHSTRTGTNVRGPLSGAGFTANFGDTEELGIYALAEGVHFDFGGLPLFLDGAAGSLGQVPTANADGVPIWQDLVDFVAFAADTTTLAQPLSTYRAQTALLEDVTLTLSAAHPEGSRMTVLNRDVTFAVNVVEEDAVNFLFGANNQHIASDQDLTSVEIPPGCGVELRKSVGSWHVLSYIKPQDLMPTAIVTAPTTPTVDVHDLVGTWVPAKSVKFASDEEAAIAGFLPVKPGRIAGGATLFPVFASIYTEFLDGGDILFPDNVAGMYLRNLEGNALAEGVFQTDRTAENGLNGVVNRTANNNIPTAVQGTGGNSVRFNNTTRSVVFSSTDPETAPVSRAYQFYIIVDTFKGLPAPDAPTIDLSARTLFVGAEAAFVSHTQEVEGGSVGTVVITFTGPVLVGTMPNPEDEGQPVEGSWAAVGSTLVFTPVTPWTPSAVFGLNTNGIMQLNGDPIPGFFSSFTSDALPDGGFGDGFGGGFGTPDDGTGGVGFGEPFELDTDGDGVFDDFDSDPNDPNVF